MGKEASMKAKVGPIVLVLGILIILTVGYVTVARYMTSYSYYNTLSLSRVEFDDAGNRWIYTFKAPTGGMLEKMYFGKATPSKVESETGKEPDSTFSLGATFHQTCEWKIIKDVTKPKLYKYEVRTYNFPKYQKANPFFKPIEWCKENAPCRNVVAYGYRGGLSTECLCVGKYEVTPAVGTLSHTEVRTIIDLVAEGKGESYSGKIDTTKGSASVNLGPYVYVKYQGDLTAPVVGCDRSEITDSYVPIYYNNRWRLVSKSSYDLVKQRIDSLEQQIDIYVSKNGYDKDTLTVLVDRLNSAVDNLLSQDMKYCNGRDCSEFVSSSSISGAELKIEPEQLAHLPVLTAYVDADWIKVKVLAPKFEIVKTSSECFKSVENGNLLVTIRNTGDTGSYHIYALCPSVQSRAVDGTLDGGEEKTINLILSGTTTEEKHTEECKIILEYTGPDFKVKRIETTQEVCVERSISCTPGDKWCDGNKIMECSPEGNMETVKTCKETCTLDSEGNPICSEEKTECSKDEDCDDGDPLTKDVCVGILKKHCEHKDIGVICEWYEDGEKKTERLPADECCEKKGGIWVPPKEYSWWEKLLFGKEDVPGHCRIPHYPVQYILMIIAGAGIFIYGNYIWKKKGEMKRGRMLIFIGLAIAGIGSILLALAGGGFI